jgi:hypothetical protein
MPKLDYRRLVAIAGFVLVALITGLAVADAASQPRPKAVTINCPFLANGQLEIDVPANRKSMPKIDFDYPAKATIFYFADGQLMLVAVDEGNASRPRVIVSAQLNKKTGAYDGQIFTDTGGNELMYDNGPVHCTVGPG